MLPELFWLESLNYFELLLCSWNMQHFVVSIHFAVWEAAFSISLSMYLSHADGGPKTNPRTLKPSTIVIFVP